MPRKLYVNEDNDVVISRVRFDYGQSYINDGTLTCLLKDSNGVVIVSGISMVYQLATNGEYRGVILQADVASLAVGADYYIEIMIDANTADGFRRIKRKAAYHSVE